MTNSVGNYHKWIKAVCNEYEIEENDMLKSNTPYCCTARKLFFSLCVRDGIDIGQVSRKLGRPRTSGIHIIKNKVGINKQIQDKLWNGDSQL